MNENNEHEYETLRAELGRAFGTRKSVPLSGSAFGLAAGMEALAPGAPYHWDGQKRGGDPAHTYLVFQVTLSGWGTFNSERVTPGRAFTALVPSAHCYQLPPQSPGWAFFWVIVYHPYVLERVQARQKEMGAIVDVSPAGGLLPRTAQMAADVCGGGFRDRWAEEAALLGWLCEYERACDSMLYPAAPRETLLADVRGAVLARLSAPPDVSALAWARGHHARRSPMRSRPRRGWPRRHLSRRFGWNRRHGFWWTRRTRWNGWPRRRALRTPTTSAKSSAATFTCRQELSAAR